MMVCVTRDIKEIAPFVQETHNIINSLVKVYVNQRRRTEHNLEGDLRSKQQFDLVVKRDE